MLPWVMIDLETMDTKPSAAIVSLGACAFDHRTGELASTFYRAISLGSNTEVGRTISTDTLLWWMQQSDSARAALVTDTLPLLKVLTEFQLWANPYRDGLLWANDPDFDAVILSSAMETVGLRYPFMYFNHRSVRTVKQLAHPLGDFPPFEVDGTAHNALDDAIKQACEVVYATQRISTGLTHLGP